MSIEGILWYVFPVTAALETLLDLSDCVGCENHPKQQGNPPDLPSLFRVSTAYLIGWSLARSLDGVFSFCDCWARLCHACVRVSCLLRFFRDLYRLRCVFVFVSLWTLELCAVRFAGFGLSLRLCSQVWRPFLSCAFEHIFQVCFFSVLYDICKII